MRKKLPPLLLLLCLLLAACYVVEDHPVPLPGPTPTPTTDFAPIQAYFTGGAGVNPADALVEAIDSAQASVYVAVYSLSLDNITAALIHAHQRGVDVRLVMESQNLEGPDEDLIESAGIKIVGDTESSLMHNKFAVIDGYEVWTGSMNFTDQGAGADANNLIRINSSRLAQSYTAEFLAMYQDGKFGPGDDVNIPYEEVTLDGVRMRLFFSPHHAPGEALAELIRSAEREIDVMAYLWTSTPLARALLAEAEEGVLVRGVFESDQVQSDPHTRFPLFVENGLDVRLDANPQSLMHNKVIIIDRQVVALGSYNFSASAEERNDENLLIVYSQAIAQAYYAEFERLYSAAAAP